ncbi:MAG: ATP synthase F1 subunit delta [Nitrospirae bacterium RIFCSPLOWO2_02_FULL_62_14]|nr:MAG: ATP synthase F1 subunit delta [Nitrospirae bacterium RIFCSPLOWO2_01_FULL_62_17]OGW67947.1 MAG: ATP synthase F1 subunit delta [Nitrospirae bacterium RIFCSPLOWO2_02_FULL_62_14]
MLVIKSSVARRYAKALFELLDAKSIEPARSGLAGLGQAFLQSPSLKHVLASPAFVVEEKLSVLTALTDKLHGPPVMKSFLAQLVHKNRIGLLPEIADAFAALADQSKGTGQATVTSAAALNAPEQERVRARLRELLKRDVEITFQTEPRLLGGLQIRIGSTLYDSSVRSRLNTMQTILTKE